MKKWLLAAASLLMVVTLAGCGSNTIATLKGGKVTQDEFYKEIKETSKQIDAIIPFISLLEEMLKAFGAKDKEY